MPARAGRDLEGVLKILGEGGLDDAIVADFGRCCSKMPMMAARCVPASTASNDPFAQSVAVALTSKPVTLSSFGPPPEPYSGNNVSIVFDWRTKETQYKPKQDVIVGAQSIPGI